MAGPKIATISSLTHTDKSQSITGHMPKILLIEDNATIAQQIVEALEAVGIKCDSIGRGREGLEVIRVYGSRYDLVVLDLGLPDLHGNEVLQRVRAAKIRIPIIILTAAGDLQSKLAGLGYGADDYMTKPFETQELIARISALIRRSKGHAESVIRFDRVAINLDTRTVEVNDVLVRLTNKEYQLLELLAMRRGTILTKEMCLDYLYGGMDEPEFKIIDVFMCKLRKKLFDASGGQNYIETIWGRGYTLRDIKSDQEFMLGQFSKKKTRSTAGTAVPA